METVTRSYVAWAVAIFVGGGLLALISPRPVQEAWTFEEANKHDIDSAVRVLAYDADEAIACGLLHLESLPSNARNGAFLDVDNDGTVVKEIDNRKGRRATGKFVPHSDCNENIAKRKRKYDEYEAADRQAGRN